MALKKEFGLKTSETDWLDETGSIRDPAVGKQLLTAYLANTIGKASAVSNEEDTPPPPSGKVWINLLRSLGNFTFYGSIQIERCSTVECLLFIAL